MRVGLDPRAAAELDDAADWYERQRAGLGRELVFEVRAPDGHSARSPAELRAILERAKPQLTI